MRPWLTTPKGPREISWPSALAEEDPRRSLPRLWQSVTQARQALGEALEGWPGESYESIEVIQHLVALDRESSALGHVNRKLGGEPIPLRRR